MKMPLKKRVKNKGEQNTSLKTELFVRRNKMCLIYMANNERYFSKKRTCYEVIGVFLLLDGVKVI